MKIKKTKIFRWIWRVNAILIFLAGFGTICLIGAAIFSIMKEQWRFSKHNSVQVRTEQNQTLKTKFNYGSFQQVEGTNFLMSPISSEQQTFTSVFESSSNSFKTGYSTAVRNFAFLNLADQSTRFLLPGNDWLITSNSKITEKKDSSDNEKSVITHISYQIVKNDSNNDGQLNQKDKISITFSDIDGTNFVEILTGIDEILGEKRVDDNSMLYIYSSDGKRNITLVNLAERKTISTKELPVIN